MLLNKNGNFEEVFKENDSATSGTKNVQVEEFTASNGIKCRIVDVIEFNDAKSSSKEAVNRIKESVCEGDYNIKFCSCLTVS